MCGITGYLGNDEAFVYLLESLLILQNRGYDSAGICTIDKNENFICHKHASTSSLSAIEILSDHRNEFNGSIGIGHTRWATHGGKTDVNAHPHFDSKNDFCVVHNGIIENYIDIKQMLTEKGMSFQSQTDTEVVPKLLEYFLSLEMNRSPENIDFEKDVLQKTIQELQGTWALLIMFRNTPNKLYLCKNGSPLILGIDHLHQYAMISSEPSAISNYFSHYVSLNDGDIVTLSRENGKIKFPSKTNYTENVIENKITELSCYPYPHWTIKEICEQPMSIMRTLNMGGRILSDTFVKLGGLDSKKDILLECDHCLILGCGTSFHAGQIGCKMLRNLRCFTSVNCVDASEFTFDDISPNGKTCIVLLSQSGETKDVHRCIEIIRSYNRHEYPILSIVNVVGSLIARESDCGIYLNAGREVGVASTKSFTSQIVALSLMSIWFSQNRKTCQSTRGLYISCLRKLSLDVEELLSSMIDKIRKISNSFIDVRQMFLLGRGYMKYIADEGALKIKEIGYIHAEGYAGGSLKHGPFALIDPNTVVILIAPRDEHFSKMMNAAEEIYARNAKIILITTSPSQYSQYKKELFQEILTIPHNEMFQSVLSIIPLQLLAYEIAKNKGHNPDFPKNLAKVVTVDG